LLVAVTVGAWQLRRKFPYLLTGWLWYVVTLLPVIGLIQVGGQAMADRYTYVPLIGIFIAMAWAFWDLARQRVASHSVPTGKRKLAATPPRASAPGLAPLRASRGEASGQGDQTRTRWAIGASLAAIFLCLAPATRHCVGYWQDSFAVFSRVLSVAEACDTAHFNLGLVLATQQSKFAEAAEHFARAASLNPHHAGARFSLGLCLEKLDDRTQAAHWYREALTVDPANGPAHHNLAICLEVSGQQTEAIAHYEAALKAMPQDALVRTNLANAHANLAASLYTQGRYADAWQAIDSCRRYGGVPPPALLTNLMEQLPQAGRQ
jgi:tetratricopeptide (TPR) repeat protein